MLNFDTTIHHRAQLSILLSIFIIVSCTQQEIAPRTSRSLKDTRDDRGSDRRDSDRERQRNDDDDLDDDGYGYGYGYGYGDDEDEDGGNDDGPNDDGNDRQEDDPDKLSPCQPNSFGESSLGDNDSQLALTTATASWTVTVKPFLATNCVDCHSPDGQADSDYTKYAETFASFSQASNDGFNNEQGHSDLSSSVKNQAMTISSSWFSNFYARGEGYDQFETQLGADFADLENDYEVEIRLLLEDRCVLCHNNYEGVPMSTGLAYNDFRVVANSAPAIILRLEDSEKPMPPEKVTSNSWVPVLTGTEREKIVTWLNANKSELAKVKLANGSTTEIIKTPCQ